MNDSHGSSMKRGSAKTGQGRDAKRDQFEQRQVERQREKEEQARKQRIRRNLITAGIALAVVVIGVFVVRSTIDYNAQHAPISGVVTYSGLARSHVNVPVTYPQNPPVGGNHWPIWLNCGMYTQPITNENAVHSMEHGAVWITYQPNLPAASITQLQNLVRSHGYVVLSPYTGLPAPVVASAWGVQLQVQSASDSRLARFITTYERGSQTPEPGATCSNGVGAPIG